MVEIMAMTLEALQTQREQLITRVASLQKRITAGDRTVEYDLTAARMALEMLDKEISSLSPTKRYSFNAFSKG